MTTPSYIATGFTSDGQNAVSLKIASAMRIASRLKVNIGTSGQMNLGPTYGSNAAGDLFLAEIWTRNNASALTYPQGWTLRAGPDTFGNSSVFWLSRDARSVGSETGGVIFQVSANSALSAIHTFRDVALTSFFESLSANGDGSNVGTVNAPTVNAGAGAGRLAVAMGGAGEAVSGISSFTGATGGTWNLDYSSFTLVGNNGAMWLETAALAASSSITGGSFAIAPDENYAQQGFALVGT